MGLGGDVASVDAALGTKPRVRGLQGREVDTGWLSSTGVEAARARSCACGRWEGGKEWGWWLIVGHGCLRLVTGASGAVKAIASFQKAGGGVVEALR
jgi:hypothetical protein